MLLRLRRSLFEVALTVAAGAAYGVAYASLGGSLPHSLLFRIIEVRISGVVSARFWRA